MNLASSLIRTDEIRKIPNNHTGDAPVVTQEEGSSMGPADHRKSRQWSGSMTSRA
jgi:hypothetical protein